MVRALSSTDKLTRQHHHDIIKAHAREQTSNALAPTMSAMRDRLVTSIGQMHALQIEILARHRASKVSNSFSANACASSGLLGCAMITPPASPLEPGSRDISVGHSSNDFESMGLPAYQHFRPLMRR